MKNFFISFFILFINCLNIFSINEFPEPLEGRIVHDFSNILTTEEEYKLEEKLVKFSNETSTQIAIVTLDDLYGNEINDYAARLGEKWGVGQKGKDNGIIILIAPKLKKVSIQVGYGLEGVIPDAIAKRIIENEIIPEFKNGNYYAGLDKATNVLMSLAKKEFSANEYYQQTSTEKKIPFFVALIIVGFIIIFVILIPILLSSRSIHHISTRPGLPWWLLLLMMSQGKSQSRGKFNDFSSGRGSFGGFSSGGFGGFGGGSFGGGGASGSW